jgi:hypothetical protein
MGQLEIEALKSLIFENAKSISAVFMLQLFFDQNQESWWPFEFNFLQFYCSYKNLDVTHR